MRCIRCGDADHEPGVRPDVHVDTVTVRVNETVDLLRVPLCTFCCRVLAAAIDQALRPVTSPSV